MSGAHNQKATDKEVRDAYRLTQSVYQAAALLEMAPPTVYERLRKLNVELTGHQRGKRWEGKGGWREAEKRRLRREFAVYRDQRRLPELARRMRRSVDSINGMATELGLERKSCIQWTRMTEADARVWFDDFCASKVCILNYCRRRGISNTTAFSRTMHRHFDDEFCEAVERAFPKRTWYARGRHFELTVRKELEKNGYPHVVRSFLSRGVADLTAVGPGGTLLVQCKRGGYMSPAEHNDLWRATIDEDGKSFATPILAGLPDGRKRRYWVLTGPHTKRGFRPLREITLPWSAAAEVETAAARIAA